MNRDDPRASLYPFLAAPGAPAAAGALLEAASRSAREKFADIVAARHELADTAGPQLAAAAREIAARLERGGRMLACGNGGSATDAADVVADCLTPPRPGWRVIPALALPDHTAMVTAVGNDVGFEQVYARQIIALAEPADVLILFSTSGASPNILAAAAEAARQRLLAAAFVGSDDAALARGGVRYRFTVQRRYIPRIQEAHATLWHALLTLIQHALGGAGQERV